MNQRVMPSARWRERHTEDAAVSLEPDASLGGGFEWSLAERSVRSREARG